MLTSKCSVIIAAIKRPRLSALMSSARNPHAVLDLLQSSGNDDLPPTAPADSYPRAPDSNPLRPRTQFGPGNQEQKNIYHLHWKSTRHNTIATFTNAEGKLRSWASGGLCGFKHSRRGEYEAGYQCAVRIFKNIEALMETESFKLELIYKGFGQGRQALDSALLTTEGDKIRPLICRLTDRTPLKFGGTRARKARRL
jgi:small subunit ribosomal protein S11